MRASRGRAKRGGGRPPLSTKRKVVLGSDSRRIVHQSIYGWAVLLLNELAECLCRSYAYKYAPYVLISA